jgi:hypothetical protein
MTTTKNRKQCVVIDGVERQAEIKQRDGRHVARVDCAHDGVVHYENGRLSVEWFVL